MIAGDGRLAGMDQLAPGDALEGINGKRGGAVGGGQKVGIELQGGPRPHWLAAVHAVGPDDLLGGGHGAGLVGVGPNQLGLSAHRGGQLTPAQGEDASGGSDLLLHRRQGQGLIALLSGQVHQAATDRVELEAIALAGVLNSLGRLHHVQSQVERVAPKDVAHGVAAHDDQVQARLLGDGLEPGRAHLARGADAETVTGDHEGLSGGYALTKIRHQVAESACLPAVIQRIQAFRDAILAGGDLVGIDGVEFLGGIHAIPEDQGLALDRTGLLGGLLGRDRIDLVELHAGQKVGGLDGAHGGMLRLRRCQPCSGAADRAARLARWAFRA